MAAAWSPRRSPLARHDRKLATRGDDPRRAADSPVRTGTSASGDAVSPWRVRLINGLIAAIAGGHLFDMLTGKEHWPFSGYPMFSALTRDKSVWMVHLCGVTREDTPREVPLLKGEYLWPFDRPRFRAALLRLDSAADREGRLREALNDVLDRYEARRAEGRHNGPALRGIRLYKRSYRLDPWARNHDQPDRRRLIFELMRRAT